MDKVKLSFLILVLFLGYLFYSAFSSIDRSNLKRAALDHEQEAVFETMHTDDLPKSNISSKPLTDPLPTTPPDFPKTEEPAQRNDPPIENGDRVSLCYTQLGNCRAKDIMFDYPSDQNPWSEDADRKEVECLTLKKNCTNSNPQELSDEEELQIINYYNQKKQESLPEPTPMDESWNNSTPLQPDGYIDPYQQQMPTPPPYTQENPMMDAMPNNDGQVQ